MPIVLQQKVDEGNCKIKRICSFSVFARTTLQVGKENRLSRPFQGRPDVVPISTISVTFIVLDKDITIIFGRVVREAIILICTKKGRLRGRRRALASDATEGRD